MLNLDTFCFENNVDPDQLASGTSFKGSLTCVYTTPVDLNLKY